MRTAGCGFGLLFAGLSLAAFQTGPASAQEPQSTDIARSAQECAADPAYAPGGANVGDCLLDRAARLEPLIDTALHRASKRFCDAETRERFRQVQTHWHDYRQAFCSLIEEYPGNTPAYVNAAACHLQATQQRMEALQAVGEAAHGWCLALSFQHEASRFGPPSTASVRHPGSGLEWRMSSDGGTILVSRDRTEIAALDAAGCSWCDDGADCSEGVFLFDYPSPAEGDPAFRNLALLHACEADDGVRLELARDLLTAPETALRETGLPSLDWHVDDNALTLTASDGTVLTWTAPDVQED